MAKKFLKFQASAVLVLSLLLSACSNSGSSDKGSGADKEKAASDTVPVFVIPSSRIENLETNSVTKYIEDEFNIKFKFEVAQGSNAGDKKKLLLASGDYPAVFLSRDLTQAEQIEYGKQGVLKPLNDLIEKYGVEIKKAFQQDPDLKKSITAPDGKIYALPHINECFHCWYSQKVWINTTWLKKLNLQMPTTTEEFYQVLKAFKTQDPNGNGKQDEIPLSGADKTWHGNPAPFLMNSFIYDNDDNFFFMKDGKVGLSANQPGWRKGLEYINKLYSEGLIDKEAFTQDNDAMAQVGNRQDTRRTRDIRESWAVPNNPLSDNGYEHRLYLETAKNYEGKQPKETFPLSIFMESADAKEAAQLKTQINDYIRSNMAQFITGAKKLTDAEWDNYVKGFDGLKIKRYLEIYQKAYDSSFKK